MRSRSAQAWLLGLVGLVAACGDRDVATEPAGVLPSDPAEWVCEGGPPSPNMAEIDSWCRRSGNRGEPAPVALRSPPPIADLAAKNDYDELAQDFMRRRAYASDLGWKGDLGWRMTGPYVGKVGEGESYGVHPAVRIYYSPEVVDWLCAGRVDPLPDGAMIVKEMHPIDAALDITLIDDACMVIGADVAPDSWAIMVKASGASHDGWYWAGYSAASTPPVSAPSLGNPPIFDRSAITSDRFFEGSSSPLERNPLWYPTGYVYSDAEKLPDVVFPYSEYGKDCINCHASAQSESTFSSLDNLVSDGLLYRQFSSGGDGDGEVPGGPHSLRSEGAAEGVRHPALMFEQVAQVGGYDSPFPSPRIAPLPEFLAFYDQLGPVRFADAWELRLPAETYDHVVSGEDGPEQYLTSDQCIACHDSTYQNSGIPNMIFVEKDGETETLINLSPYGEWRASPMGLAGRDPIFFSQLQSETNNLPQLTECIENTCLHCHGVMGQRQLALDTQGQSTEGCESLFPIPPPSEVPFGTPFRRRMVTQWPNSENNADQKYGALARDGISCAVCHHIAEDGLGEENTFTGNFVAGPADEVYGPYADDTVVTKPMEHALGITPQLGEQIESSDLCGTCHNILLPIFDNAGNRLGASYEQTTHLEWLNSDFAPNGPDPQSCQDCHMPKTYKGTPLKFEIASIESSQSAPTTHRLPDDEIDLTERDQYGRHSLHGLNVFLNEMFQQFPLLLGVRQIDYMTGTNTVPSLVTGLNSMLEMATQETARVAIEELEALDGGRLRAVVRVTNEVGHYLPSGVGFRRVFLEFVVRGRGGEILWSSGRTNEIGAIVDGATGLVLPSEEPVEFPEAPFQPHYQLIERQDQVQIYQELIEDSDGHLTTSFLRRVTDVKDNRIRPKGYDPAFFAGSTSPYIRELAESHGRAGEDPYYTDPSLTGADVIEYVAALDPGALEQADTVEVTLYSQSIPPFYLQQRFRDANRGPGEKDDIDRLYYLTSHLNVADVKSDAGSEVVSSWKLELARDRAGLP